MRAGSEVELIERYLDGESEAVEIVDRWITGAARSYRRRLGDRWEDVVQEARLETFRLLRDRRFRGESKLSTFLWRVVSHTCLDALRALERRGRFAVNASDESLESLGGRVEDRASAYEVTDLVLRIMEEVPAHCREIWALILEGKSYREMSQQLGVSDGALRVRALRCRRQALEARERLISGCIDSDRAGETKLTPKRQISEGRK